MKTKCIITVDFSEDCLVKFADCCLESQDLEKLMVIAFFIIITDSNTIKKSAL